MTIQLLLAEKEKTLLVFIYICCLLVQRVGCVHRLAVVKDGYFMFVVSCSVQALELLIGNSNCVFTSIKTSIWTYWSYHDTAHVVFISALSGVRFLTNLKISCSFYNIGTDLPWTLRMNHLSCWTCCWKIKIDINVFFVLFLCLCAEYVPWSMSGKSPVSIVSSISVALWCQQHSTTPSHSSSLHHQRWVTKQAEYLNDFSYAIYKRSVSL